ncbi:MAG: type II toxin-antitoxin system VapC family toxin [Thermodesulfovibrionales bacterium]|nr:type II toxin-antitoxin system VapC family toxin [Thermodesulfovibrionales bacterium]
MNKAVVIDASLATMWAIPESYTAQALAVAFQWDQENVCPIAPCLMLTEVTNALYKRVIRKEIDLTTAIAALHVVMEFGVEIREEPGLHSLAMELSHQLGRHTTYDCHYLALAQIYNCEFWTGDERFYNSVKEAMHQVKWIGNYTPSPEG